MTKRRIATHEDCLKSFAHALKQDVKENLVVWRSLNHEQAIGRRMAFANIVFLLKQEASKHGIPLADLGLEDYEVPKIDE
ncbi:hypothetical protein [Massilia eburnea]|uniref:hypothetical protein n=1 Tax=Massilia eburnea TaxID=1776165 RepID=UPI003D6A2F0A